MLIYLDLIFLLNLWIDFLLLLTTNVILKYKTSYIRLFLASLVGACSTFLFLINNKIVLFIFKILFSIMMQLITNKYKGIKTLIENTFYFYLTSIILAGTLYLLKLDQLKMRYNFFLLFILTPIILKIYKKEIKKLDTYYSDIYAVTVIYKGKKYYFNAYLDTGNKLYDQYKKRPISLVYTSKIVVNYKDCLFVPIETASGNTLLKCIIVEKIIINNKEKNNVLIGLSKNQFQIQDIDMILHKDIIGGLK